MTDDSPYIYILIKLEKECANRVYTILLITHRYTISFSVELREQDLRSCSYAKIISCNLFHKICKNAIKSVHFLKETYHIYTPCCLPFQLKLLGFQV